MAEGRVLGEHQKKEAPWPNQPYYVRLAIECRGESLNDGFVQIVADALKHVIEVTTPRVDKLFQDRSETESL